MPSPTTPLKPAVPRTPHGLRADERPEDRRSAAAEALADRIHLETTALRGLDLADIAPAPVFRVADHVATAPREAADAAL
ncbi:hypothetical protein ACLIYM_27600 [Streptomyces fenghuangensis]|uniref:hypothetical protein n=1 Tax=Streptomyces sp. ICN903 TaxID=2964654 RepID=UPI001EDBA074|nr:hypothetical protein [Streptomyces sp. ICN903]MCG3041862.1 hypothetical protein [Streptomyces sp. ICN903]